MKAQVGDVRGRTGKMYSTGVLCTSDSATLQKQSFFPPNILFFLCNRGREDVREMKKKPTSRSALMPKIINLNACCYLSFDIYKRILPILIVVLKF